MNRMLVYSTVLWTFCVGALACAEMIYPQHPPLEPVELLPSGITNQISRDYHSQRPSLADVPDRSFKTLWLRTFPLINVPLGDPFPQTKNVNAIDITNAGGLNFYDMTTGQLLGNAKSVQLDFTQGYFTLGADRVPLAPTYIAPAGTQMTELRWDKGVKDFEVGIRVRGALALEPTVYTLDGAGNTIPNPVPQWSVINVIELDKYLLSVVPSEISAGYHAAMLEAQAIAARTYSLNQMAQARIKNRNWDMDPTTWYQSYRGYQFLVNGKWQTVEAKATSNATVATAGKALVYSGEVIQAFFSGNSGGVTCTASECFNQPDVPYLVQVADAPGVTAKPGGTWGTKATLTPANITAVLTKLNLTPASPVVKLEALQKGPSGRTWQLRVKLKNGQIDLDPTQTRKMMHLFGPIRSFLYSLGTVSGGKQSISGHGYGHGVGLSQEGGEIFAAKGWSAEKILNYYYPNTQLKAL